jgi:hypothetical protein
MLLLTAKDIQPLLGIDAEVIKNLMKNQVIISKTRKEILGTASTEYMTTPIHVIDFVAENFGIDKEQARQYFLSFFHKIKG